MEANFLEHYQEIISLGLVDNRYPLDHACVQLPNGWYGIDSILTGFQKVLDKYMYDEMLVPTVSTNAIFKQIPDEIKDNIDQSVLTITHTGLHKLDDPFYLSGRPDLVAPQIEKYNCRSYRDLPVRRALRYFRYIKTNFPKEVSLITDTEYPALDAEGIFATEEEYLEESSKVLNDFRKFLEEKLRLSVFTARTKYALVFYTIFPDLSVLEVARLNLFGRDLAEKLEFTVLESNNKPAPPCIFDLNITSKMFAAVVATHSVPHRVVLPSYCMRVFGTSYGVDVSGLKGLRIDQSRIEFTPERFAKQLAQGAIFALKPAEGGSVCIVTEGGETVVEAAALEAKLAEIVEKREVELAKKEKETFQERLGKAVQYIKKDAAVPEGYAVLGAKEDDPETLVVAKTFLPSQ
ncbi:hypothetical protein TRFO_02739 [Tritrichomonas foetus]|uniref:Uncharacterized protein n=1 Tax=Tritrichomonas foetus TaxID=1144522 RepID=A0A1J4KYY7_9EUKA|nr:hypothetical protein TRFO_02739 [Tritrichomonas foetus]|eukprot:OHT16465.1 hypothetical protein TRFO_02739 [Tritrichomonas foetus]